MATDDDDDDDDDDYYYYDYDYDYDDDDDEDDEDDDDDDDDDGDGDDGGDGDGDDCLSPPPCSFQRSSPHGGQPGSGHEGERPRGVLHQLNQEPRHQQVEEDEMYLI